MSDKIMEEGNSADGNKCIIEKIITISGLNLLITPDKQYESCSVLSISLSVAGVTGFLGKEPGYGRALVFSLEDTKKKAGQMLAQYGAMHGDITVIYVYQPGTFGNRIEEGLDVFLQDNPRIKMVVIDSLAKIVEAELGRMEYVYAYRKLDAIKNVANRYGVLLLAGIHDGNPEDNGMLAGIADTVLKITTEGENWNNHKYTLHVNRKDMPGKEITAEFDANNCTWKQIADK